MKFLKFSPPPAESPRPAQHISLTRTFVETGDERCPFAGTWSRLPDAPAAPEEPESPWPVLSWLRLAGRAFHPTFNPI